MEYDYIECCDCLEAMRKLPSHCVDVAFTSPPYNDIGNKNQNVAEADEGGCTHKKYIHVEQRSDWLEWMIEVIDEMRRVSKKWVLFNVQALKSNRENVYKLIGHYADCIHDAVIWYKPNGLPTSTPNKISNTYEFLLIIKCEGVKSVDVNSKFYRNVIIQNNNSNREFAKIHRAVMAKNFCDEVIKEFTKEGDIVLDPFLGTGTAAVCCVEQNRHYIGYELSDVYFDVASKRLDEVEEGLPV